MLPHLLLGAALLLGPEEEPAPGAATRLVVVVSIDQCIPEQMERLAPLLEGGLARVWREGTVFRDAALDYSNSETGPGHATLATGCLPRTHGISGNTIYRRDEAGWRYCVGDPGVRSVTQAGAQEQGTSASPRNLAVPALGDLLKAQDARAQVVAVSSKDRSAVLMGGQDPDLVLWWDSREGGYQTSTAYGDALPEWVRTWNRTWLERTADREWTNLHPLEEYHALGTAPDRRDGEPAARGTLPLMLHGGVLGDPAVRQRIAQRVPSFPVADRFAIDVGQRAVAALHLGGDDAVDLLALGLSTCDYVGHARGPYSVEVTDLLLRVDRWLGRLFGWLDGRLGEDAWTVVVTADHGVCELPEALAAQGIPARRFTLADQSLAGQVVQQITARFLEGTEQDGAGQAVLRVREVGLQEERLQEAGVDVAALRRALAEGLETLDWVHRAYTREDLQAPGGDPLQDLFHRSYRADRCPDVVLCPVPRLVFSGATGTNHGTPWEYDRRIPLAFRGPGIPAQARQGEAHLVDLVPTLLEYLGMALPPHLDGQARTLVPTQE